MQNHAGAATAAAQETLDLPQGRMQYLDQGTGPPVVLVNGLFTDSAIWDRVVPGLIDAGLRCIRPGLPVGSHKIPMDRDADLSPTGIAALLGDFLERLELDRAVLVGNDSGGALIQLLAASRTAHDRIGGLVLTNCDMFDKFPPFPYSLLPTVARAPGGIGLLNAVMRSGLVRRASFWSLAASPIPPELVDRWLDPFLTEPAIREDSRKLMAGVDPAQLVAADLKLADFERPVLFAWGVDDPFFKLRLAQRLAATLPNARVEQIPECKTYVMLDQPQRLAELITEFTTNLP